MCRGTSDPLQPEPAVTSQAAADSEAVTPMSYPIGLTCQELVELVTNYLENSLEPDARVRFELHLGVCPGCVDYLDQMRLTMRATGTLREESLDPAVRSALLDAFRAWRVTDRRRTDTEPA